MTELPTSSLIDNHVHVFAPHAADPAFDPLATFTLGGDDPAFLETNGRHTNREIQQRPAANTRHTMAYQGALCAIARYYGCEPTRDAVQRWTDEVFLLLKWFPGRQRTGDWTIRP